MNTKLNFDVLDVLNKKIMYIVDSTYYDELSTLNTSVEITFPFDSKKYSVNIEAGELAKLTTKHLKRYEDIVDYPDGVYTITMISDQLECRLTKKIFRVVDFMLEFMELTKNLDLSNKDLLTSYNRILIYLHGVHSNVSENEDLAMDMYTQAKDELTNFKCF